jgi:hypothetical protein
MAYKQSYVGPDIPRGVSGTTSLSASILNNMMDDLRVPGADVDYAGYALRNCAGVYGPSGAPLFRVMASAYDFAQSPGGSLAIGANTITLDPLPAGLAVGGLVRVSGGTGTAEIVPVTAISGNDLTITCANTHSGAWVIGSATGGIKEAARVAGAGGVVHLTGGTTYHVYTPVGFLTNQYVIATGATIERDFSAVGNVFNFVAGNVGGLFGGLFTVGASFTEPANYYKVYALGIPYFQIDGVTTQGGWGGFWFDNCNRGTGSNLRGDTFSGDWIRMGSSANGPASFTLTNLTTSDGTGTGTAIHAKYGLMNLSNFDFQGASGAAGTSRGIYIDPDGSDYFDESTITNGIIDSMYRSIEVKSTASRFIGVRMSNLYLSTDGIGIACLNTNSTRLSISDTVCYGSGGSGTLVFAGGSNISLSNIQVIEQPLTGGSPSMGIGWIGNASNVSLVNCHVGKTAAGADNSNVSTGFFFGNHTFSGVVIDGGETKTTGGVVVTTPTTGITIRNLAGWNPVGPAAITVTASPMTYTAGNSGEHVYINGGTVSSVTRAGVTVATASPARVFVPANQSVVVTYSVAPTMVKDGI